jgi:tetratricopeptide (TPR) repeat protein
MGKRRRPHTRDSAREPVDRTRAPLAPSTLWLLPVLIFITAVVYEPAWHGSPLWDDDAHLTSAALRGTAGLWRIWFDLGATQQYYPMVHSAFWVMDAVFGAGMFGYHLVNIGLHAIVAWLVAVGLGRLGVPGARLAAVIVALHPVHVESVAWVTELKNTLSGVFYLLAALAYLRYDSDRTRRWYAIALGVFVLALLSKTVTASLPAAMIIVFWWRRGRVDWRRDLGPLLPFFVLGAAAGLTTVWVERTFIGAVGSAFDLSPIDRGLLASRAIWTYLWTLVWPANLTFIYPRWTISPDLWWQWVFPIATAAMSYWLWRLRHRTRAPLAAWLFFVVTLAPALGFVNVYPFRYSYVADHFQYLASIGVIALAAAGLVLAMRRLSNGRRLERALYVVVGLPLAILSWRQSHDYVDAETLYQTTLERNPECWLAHNNLGLIRQRQGRFDLARAAHEAAVRLEPRYAEGFTNLGVDLAALGHADEALARYDQAIRLQPLEAGAHHNKGVLLQQLGRLDEAIAAERQAVRIDPEYADAYDNLGTSLQRAGRIADAIAAFQEATRLEPLNGALQNNLGGALFAAGRLDEAAAALREAAQRLPNASLTQDNLGRVLLEMGKREEAAAAFAAAVRLDPRYGPAHHHFGRMQQEAGRWEDAVASYEEAVRLMPESAEAHNDLGVALATIGRLDEAARHFAEAVGLRPDFAAARANLARARGK